MENKNNSYIKKEKRLAKTFTANFFEDGLDSFDFLNDSLINNKGIQLLNKNGHSYQETADESTAVLPEEPVKKIKKRQKRKSLMGDEEPAVKHIEEKQNRHKKKSEEPAKNVEKIHKRISSSTEKKQHPKTFTANFFDDRLDFLNDSLINNTGIKVLNRNIHTCTETDEENSTFLSEEPVPKVKKRKPSSTEEGEQAVKHIEEKKKRHKTKSTFEELDNESLSGQNDPNVKVFGETISKEKKKRHKNKAAFLERDIVVEKDTSVEIIGEDNRHKSKLASVECMLSDTNVEVLGEEIIKKSKRYPKTKSAFTNHDSESIVVPNEGNVEAEELMKKKKKHKRDFSAVVQDDDICLLLNIDSIREDPVKKMKKHKKETHTLGPVKNNCLMNADFTKEKPAKVKKHRYKLYSQTATDNCFAVQESSNKKENKQKDKSTYLDCSDQSYKTQSDSGFQSLYDNHFIKKEIEDSNLLIQDSADEDCLGNSRLTNYIIKEENTMLPFEDEDDELLGGPAPVSISVSDLDLNEEPVEFEIPPLHSNEKLHQIHEEERLFLMSQGVSIKLGKFTKLEDSLLKRNYNEFTKRFHVNDPQVLLGIGQTFRNNDVISFLKAKHFYVRLGKDLADRPLYNIYKRARLLFNPLRNEARLDKTDINRLKKAYSLMGSKWQKIGNVIDKSAETTRNAFFWYDKSVNRGKWTAEEENQLISAIKTVSGITDLAKTEIDGNISWEKVASLVPTRNFHQCRLHWFENLSCKFKKMCWTKKDYGKLVSILRKEFYVDDSTKINWKAVQKCFGDISWQFLRKKWYHLAKKFRKLNNHEKVMTCKQMLDHYCITYNVKTF